MSSGKLFKTGCPSANDHHFGCPLDNCPLFIRLTFKVCGMEGGVVVQWMSDGERAVVSYHIRLEVIVKT